MDEAYNLYQAHAFKMGFSVRKGQQQFYDNDRKNIRMKEYYCFKQWFKSNELQGEVAYERADSRTGCQAMVQFNVSKEGQWKIKKLVLDHNHEFAQPHQRHLLRSMRNISATKGYVIKSLINVGMSVTNAWSYIGEEIGGFDKVGSTVKYMQNFVYTQKVKFIEASDAQSLVNQLQKRQSEDPMFYYSVQFDQESRLTNVFWRDGKSKLDYDCFGDVMVFDTTYHANRFNFIYAPFVGVNHHWQNMMFGCALLADETTVSFRWLFKVFFAEHGKPTTKNNLHRSRMIHGQSN
ncbi:PREDICTED: protein FAR1-RELATED SEQUENCE 5-like [Lupinus angustifolius]|uniref:protein FAR1-RELATED SEQUENCE 5-like n=1 Tax=Lupinus angustifolius TaxID=3871 RepID=UPI00092F4539|nr:PREDICTED: protein FAR1-RELATED SEQUENCE 5-like [Lupinus angustifolius]